MYRTINGWTKERMKAQIRARNDGTAAMEDGACLYETTSGNHCAVGCFIPAGHDAMGALKSADALLAEFEELRDAVPLDGPGLLQMQMEHDRSDNRAPGKDVRDVLCDWIDKNVVDA